YLNLFPYKLTSFTANRVSIIRYILPPKRKKLLQKYEDAKEEIHNLRKFLPICAKCKKIRDDEGNWNRLEDYMIKHVDLNFTHGICPHCEKEALKELENWKSHKF
ncbi:MAG: hypothetical protein ACTSRK_00570, partial [Promethearchaeota archaeon]